MSLSWEGITFGVELELSTPCPSTKRLFSAIAPASAARLNMAELLAKNTSFPVACACTHSMEKRCPVCETIPEEDMVVDGGRDAGILTFPAVAPCRSVLNHCFLFKPEYLDRETVLSLQRQWPGVEICTPVFGAGELASGLVTMKTLLSNIRNMGLDITADQSCGMHVHVGVESGMTLLLAQKISTLVVLLENSLLLRLVAPSRWVSKHCMPVCEDSQGARQGVSNGDLRNDSLFDQHVPPMTTMQPAEWNDNGSERYYRLLRAIWQANTLASLSLAIRKKDRTRCAFTLCLRCEKPWQDPVNGYDMYHGTPSTVEFRYSQMTFDHELLRNWTEIVTRIVVLAQADAATFKKIAASIIQINYAAEVQGKAAWKSLMRDVLGLEHRVGEWEVQLGRFERGEYISLLDENLLLKAE
ncbi:Ff.00g033080.m01.CDS01 [Fusarium sp. VM40]|nr:Ff.00g033080.m01.CDS01 [Fusarium sp. VM40]